jgi:hypothetical protein
MELSENSIPFEKVFSQFLSMPNYMRGPWARDWWKKI